MYGKNSCYMFWNGFISKSWHHSIILTFHQQKYFAHKKFNISAKLNNKNSFDCYLLKHAIFFQDSFYPSSKFRAKSQCKKGPCITFFLIYLFIFHSAIKFMSHIEILYFKIWTYIQMKTPVFNFLQDFLQTYR